MHCFAEHPKATQEITAFKSRHAADGSLRIGGLQAKLAVSTPGDVYEQDADRMAEQVLRMPDTAKGPSSPCRGSCPECHPPAGVLRKSAGAAERGAGGELPPASEAAIHAVAGGQSLSEQQRRYFEPLFGADFSGVRLHTGPSADQAAESIGALAYTRGRDVVFRRDHYRPETESGQQLLAHELAHTVQQGSAPAKSPSADRSNGNFLAPLRTHSAESSVLRLQRQEELQNRTLQELFVVTESFEAFQQAMEEWLARYVMSSAAREEALVRASNLPALHQQLVIGMPGQTVRIQATLEAGLDRYERVIFSTPGLTILDPIAITGSPPEDESLTDRFRWFPVDGLCLLWHPVDVGRTWGLIARFLSQEGGDYSLASGALSLERNESQNCCDLSYVAAGHYLFIISLAPEFAPFHCERAWFDALGRSAQGLQTSYENINPFQFQWTQLLVQGNCPVSPYDPLVNEFRLEAARFVCQASDEFIRLQTSPVRGERGLPRSQPQPQSQSLEASP